MESTKRNLLAGLVVALLLPSLLSISGCGKGGGSAAEDPNSTSKRVEAAKQQREIVDKANGNFDTLSPEDKAKLNQLTGSEKNSRESVGRMAHGGGLPPSGMPRSGG